MNELLYLSSLFTILFLPFLEDHVLRAGFFAGCVLSILNHGLTNNIVMWVDRVFMICFLFFLLWYSGVSLLAKSLFLLACFVYLFQKSIHSVFHQFRLSLSIEIASYTAFLKKDTILIHWMAHIFVQLGIFDIFMQQGGDE